MEAHVIVSQENQKFRKNKFKNETKNTTLYKLCGKWARMSVFT